MDIDWDGLLIGPTTALFGTAVRYAPKAGGAFPITGVFDQAYRELDLAGGQAVTTEMPVLGVQLSQFPGGFIADQAQDDRLTILKTGLTYVVTEGRPDGKGWAFLKLNLVPA